MSPLKNTFHLVASFLLAALLPTISFKSAFAQSCVKALNSPEATADLKKEFNYEVLPWSHPYSQSEGVFEVKAETNATDRNLWELTLQLGKKEVGIFQAFNSSGEIVLDSEMMIGVSTTIPGAISFPVWKVFVSDLLNLSQKTSIALIRMTHTHPLSGIVLHGGQIGFAEPEFLSIGDFNGGLYFRNSLNEAGLNDVDFQMAAVTQKGISVGEALKQTGIKNKLSTFVRGKSRFLKPTFLYPKGS